MELKVQRMELKVIEKKEYDNTNQGYLRQNNDKKSENSPDYMGRINFTVDEDMVDRLEDGRISCTLLVSSWVKESQKIGTYLSLATGRKWDPNK